MAQGVFSAEQRLSAYCRRRPASGCVRFQRLPLFYYDAHTFHSGLTALTFVTEAYDVKKGDYVFVHTVAGGLGLIFAQIAKHRGAIVIGTTSTPEKAEIAKKHGATGFAFARNEKEAHDLWTDRKNALFSGLAILPGAKAVGTDVW